MHIIYFEEQVEASTFEYLDFFKQRTFLEDSGLA